MKKLGAYFVAWLYARRGRKAARISYEYACEGNYGRSRAYAEVANIWYERSRRLTEPYERIKL